MEAFTAQKIKFSIKDFFRKCDQIRSIFCAVFYAFLDTYQVVFQFRVATQFTETIKWSVFSLN